MPANLALFSVPIRTLVALCISCVSTTAAAQVFINEIHYDNVGTDTGEAIEVAGPAGMDLAGWSLVLYNGANGTAYNTTALSGVIAELQGGLGVVVVDYPTNGLQNGSPDGIALVDDASNAVQFLSYEGTFTASGGPADGMTSVDIGVVEGSGTAEGDSLQLTGSGSFANNFTWLAPQPNTFGSINVGQTFGGGEPPEPQLVINEIDYDQAGTDAAEFIELRNNAAAPVALGGYTVDLINGSNGSSYNAYALPDVSLAAGAYFVLCAQTANTARCDLDVSPDTNLIQNGAPDAVALLLDGVVIDAVSYEGDTVTPYVEGSGSGLVDDPGTDFLGISRFPNGADTDRNNLDLSPRCITPGAENVESATDCPDPQAGTPVVVKEIHEIQGSAAASPFVGQTVTTRDNVVTAVGSDGFFMQTPDMPGRSDNNVDTSDGIFVFQGGAPAVQIGDLVEVSGVIAEFFGFTEFTDSPTVTVTNSGLPLPAAVTFDASVPSPDPLAPSCAIEFECYEGMLIRISNGTVSGANQGFGSDPIAEVHITAASSRSFREPGIEFPGLPGLPVWDGNPEIFELDPDKLGLPNQIIAAGSSFDAIGVLGFEFSGYELWPTELTVVGRALPEAVRETGRHEIAVGSLNLFRLFDDVDDPEGSNALGEPTNDTVVSSEEYQRRLTKFADYIVNTMQSPDILALQEVEKLTVLEDLAAAIQPLDKHAKYEAYLEEGNDIGGIDVGFLVKKKVKVESVTQFGFAEEFLQPDQTFDLLHDRPPLLLEVRLRGKKDFRRLIVMAVHNRSLGGIDDAGSNGERVRSKRLNQAQSIAAEIQRIQTGDSDAGIVVVGDFNAFEFSDGYVDAVGQIRGDIVPGNNLLSGDDLVDPNLINQVLSLPEEDRYSFVFNGSAQVLDHALTNKVLDLRVRGLHYARGNADFAEELIEDAGTALRASDHDGLVLYIDTRSGKDRNDDEDDEDEDDSED